MAPMRAGASLGTDVDASDAAGRAAKEALEALHGADPQLGVIFASPHHFRDAGVVLRAVQDCAGPLPVIGCVAESVVEGRREVEAEPAVAVWIASGVGDVSTYHMEFMRTESGGVFSGWRFDLEPEGVNLLIADPFTFPVDLLLQHLNDNAPRTRIVGGMASGGVQFRESRLFLDDRVVRTGAAGVRLSGVHVRTLVSQGCRPVGSPYTVTAADGTFITELGGQPPLERLKSLAASLPEDERELLAAGVQVGRVIEAVGKTELGSGDFLVRGVAGVDPQTGAIALGDPVEVGEIVQFHVRDAASADRDLRALLEREVGALGARAAGGLLFTCNGRGSRLFEEPDHDARLVSQALGDAPLAGFFCAGELGPVGGKNFLHGFTASLAMFVEDGTSGEGPA
jgi:small ligand-binding sensory domain FIST